MRGEKGFTLAEVLAAAAISVFVLGTATLLFYSVQRLGESTADRTIKDGAMQQVLGNIVEELSQASKVVYFAGRGELRFNSGGYLNAYIWNESDGSLRLYRFSDDNNDANDASHFADASITRALRPELYTGERLISERVADLQFMDAGGTVLTAAPSQEGAVIRTSVTVRTDPWGNLPETSIRTATIKLIRDYSSS